MKQDKVVILEGREAFLDAYCMQYGYSIVAIDEKLAELPDDNPNKKELMRFRHLIASANSKSDFGLLDAWLHALIIGLKAATYTIPLALAGEKFKSGRKPGSNGKFKEIVKNACAQVGTKNWQSVIRAMDGADGVDEIAHADREVWIKGEDKPRTFKTVQNIVAALNKKEKS